MPKRILIILGHPRTDSLCGGLARAYAEGAEAGGHEVRVVSLGALSFDPILHNGYAAVQPLEPDLVAAQASISWAEHLVFVYPLWWGAMPALLKGFIDRVFLPGFAFKFRDGSVFWDRLLAGRSAHLLVTMDTPPWYRVLSDGSPDVDPRGIPAGRVGFGSLHRCGCSVASPPCHPGAARIFGLRGSVRQNPALGERHAGAQADEAHHPRVQRREAGRHLELRAGEEQHARAAREVAGAGAGVWARGVRGWWRVGAGVRW